MNWLQQIGSEIGLSKERVRGILQEAFNRLNAELAARPDWNIPEPVLHEDIPGPSLHEDAPNPEPWEVMPQIPREWIQGNMLSRQHMDIIREKLELLRRIEELRDISIYVVTKRLGLDWQSKRSGLDWQRDSAQEIADQLNYPVENVTWLFDDAMKKIMSEL